MLQAPNPKSLAKLIIQSVQSSEQMWTMTRSHGADVTKAKKKSVNTKKSVSLASGTAHNNHAA